MADELVLYDLAGADPALRFSPFCWAIRLALAHKGLTARCLPWRVTEKAVLAFSGQGKVPVLVHGATVVSDSWRIAEYLQQRFPERPSLGGEQGSLSACAFAARWSAMVLLPAVAGLFIPETFKWLDARDLEYFRSSREARSGISLEQMAARQADYLKALSPVLRPLQETLDKQLFLGGETPNYADYSVFGPFMWGRCVSALQLVAEDDPIHAWRERLLDHFAGMARQATIFSQAQVQGCAD